MKILEVILIASQLAFVICLPQDIRFIQPRRLRLRQVPTESVSLGFSNNRDQGQSVPLGFQRIFPEIFLTSDRNQNQFVKGLPNLVISESPSVQFVPRNREGQDNPPNNVRFVPSESQSVGPSQYDVSPDGSSVQQAGVVFEGVFHPRSDRVSNTDHENEVLDQQHRFVITPSGQNGQDSFELNEKQKQRLPNPQIFIFRSSDVQTQPRQHRNEGQIPSDQPTATQESIVGNQRPSGTEIPTQIIDSFLQSQSDGHEHAISESLPLAVEKKASPIEKGVRGPADSTRSNATFVTRLTAPSNDPGSSNTLMITKKPCEICCIGNEVQPCKSCCAFTPLLNPKTLKTVVG